MNGALIDENNNFAYTKNSNQNSEFHQKSLSDSKSVSDLKLKHRRAQISLDSEPRSKEMTFFQALYYKGYDIFSDIIERIIDSSNASFGNFIPLRRVDRFFSEFVGKYIADYLDRFQEPCLSNRFDLLKLVDQNTIPDCLTINFKKAFILYKLVINGQYLVYADYKELFDNV